MESLDEKVASLATTEKRTYTVKEIADILGISRNHAYDYINDMGFHIIRIGAAIRIPKTEFDKWFDGSD